MKAVIKTHIPIVFKQRKDLDASRRWEASIDTEVFGITAFGTTKLEAAEDIVDTLNKDGYLEDVVELEV